MNKFKVYGNYLENGDYAIVDRTKISPKDGDCVVLIIDGCACVKKSTLTIQILE